MKVNYRVRRNKLRRLIKKSGADALLVTNFTNVTYLTGFSGDDSYLIVTGNGDIVLSDPRYTTQLEEECPDIDLEIRRPGTSMLRSVGKVVKAAGLKRVGVEAGSVTIAVYDSVCSALDNVEVVRCSGLVEQLRVIKDRAEIQSIRQAVSMAERGFDVIRNSLSREMTEWEVAYELEHVIRGLGGKGCSFPPIVAADHRAALPHATPTDSPIGGSRFVLIDWGADTRDGYKSDLTRVLVTGRISPKLQRIYRVVLRAQERAIAAIRPTVRGCDVDAVARRIISNAGYGKYFGHGLGHGLGLDIHEDPRLAAGCTTPLQAGMVVTVEPGIYLPGFGGVRIEDDVLVTKNGHEVLTSVSKKWREASAPL